MSNLGLTWPSTESKSKQAARRLARRLAAYLPTTLTRKILNESLPAPGTAHWLSAATIFADISGFTAMSEELASDGPRGAEELNRTLLLTFTAMINAIHDAGGSVAHFYGDAMMVYFPDDDGRAAKRALACARFIQSLMLSSFSCVVTTRPPQKSKETTFDLTIRIGVGYGRCLEMVVGEVDGSLEFVLAGTAVDEAAIAQQQAQAGQVVASRAVLEGAGLPATGLFRVVTEVAPVPNARTTLYWEAFEQDALDRLLALAPAFLPRALYARLQESNVQLVAEHRPATSIFVRFDGIDYESEEAGEQLQQYYGWARQIVARYGGDNSHINRILTGDKGSQLHIIFGAPVAPDAPDQAIRCALALQREKPAFIVRQQIGLAAGKAFACAVGSQNRREYTIVGGVVNLSAHLAQVCPDGAVITDETTAGRVGRFIEFAQLPAVPLKGRSQPVVLYQALGERTVSTQLQARFARWQKPPIGRHKELALLRRQMEATLGGRGGIVALSGPTGSGQVQLLAAGVHYWLERRGTGLMGVCQQHTRDVAYGPWQGIWRDLFGLTADMDVSTQAATVLSRVQTTCPDFNADASLWVKAMGLPSLIPQGQTQFLGEVRQVRLFALIRRYFATITRERPLLLVLEDVHWADQLSLDLLDDLAQALVELPLLILITFRPTAGFTCPTLSRPVCTTITLGDLPPQQVRQLIKQLIGTDRLPQLLEQRLGLRDHNGNSCPVNPLFLKESLKVMLSLGILRIEQDGLGNSRAYVDETLLGQMQVPDSIYTLLLARLDQLSVASRSLLQVASVIGREFSLTTLVAAASGMTRELALTLLEQLVAAKLVQQVSEEPEPVYVFQHALMHDVVYQNLPYAWRQFHHATIADLLAAQHSYNLKPFYPVLAYHYTRADRHQEGLKYALAAAEEARAMFANREAAELYKLAGTHLEVLGEKTHWETAVYVRMSQAQALLLLGNFTEAAVAAVHALQLCLIQRDSPRTVMIYNLLGRIQYHRVRYAHVQELAARATNGFAEATPSEEFIETYLLSGMAATAVEEYATALARLERAEELCLLADTNRSYLALVWSAKALVYNYKQEADAALEMSQRAVELAQVICEPVQLGHILKDASSILLRQGQAETALATVEEAIHQVRGVGNNLLARFLIQRAAVLMYLGRLTAMRAELEIAAELLETMDDVWGQMEANLLWGEYAILQRSWSEARDRLARAEKVMTSHGELYMQGSLRLRLCLGQIALYTRHTEQAALLFKQAGEIVESRNLSWWRPAVFYYLGLVKLDGVRSGQQEVQAARSCFEQALALAGEGGCPDYLPLILLQLANVEPDSSRRLHYLARSVECAQQRSRYRDRIACFRVAGAILAQSDDPALRQLGANCLFEVSQYDLKQPEWA